MELLSTLCAEYKNWLKMSGVIESATQKNYLCRVNRFIRELGPGATVTAWNRANVRRFCLQISADYPKASRMYVSALRRFNRWLIDQGWVQEDMTQGIPMPKCPPPEHHPIENDTIRRLLEAAPNLPNEYQGILASAMLSLLVYGGLRRGEAAGLKLADVNLNEGSLRVQKGKGNKGRTIYVCKECIDTLRLYLKARPEDCEHDYLLAWNRRFGLSYDGMGNMLKRVKAVAGLRNDGNIHPHKMRHACASRLEANGATLTDIQHFLGHSAVTTTAIYLSTNATRQKAIAHLTSLTPPSLAAPEPTLQQTREQPQKPDIGRIRQALQKQTKRVA